MRANKLFDHQGRSYELRYRDDGHAIHGQVFKGSNPISGCSFSITFETAHDLKKANGEGAIEILSQALVDGIISGQWA